MRIWLWFTVFTHVFKDLGGRKLGYSICRCSTKKPEHPARCHRAGVLMCSKCVSVCKKMTRWHFLVSCRISVIVTCRFLSVSPAQRSSKTPVTATEPSRAHSPSVKKGENGWDGSLVRKHSWIPVTKRSPLSPRAPVFSQESEAMSRWRRNFTLLFFESNSLIYSRNKQMRLITFVTPKALHHITDLWYSHRIVVDWSVCVCVCVCLDINVSSGTAEVCMKSS